MTAWTSPAAPGAGSLDAAWRAAREREQQAAVPRGRVIVSCSARRGTGGLGRHSSELEDAVASGGGEALALSGADARQPGLGALRQLARFSPPWRSWLNCVAYDRHAAARLPAAEHLIAFNGESLAQLRAARRRGLQSVQLVSANSHLRRVQRQHQLACRRHPLERPWSSRLLPRNLREYALAERILCSTAYIRESFLEEGFAEERLGWFPLTPDPRFQPAPRPAGGSRFTIVYTGSLTVAKGVPLLIEAIARLRHADLRLVLVGGWSTRGMRRFVEGARGADPRIEVSPGDPLPHLREAALCVHPTYEDGFAYAPAEALAAGVPTIVSEDTGMKELITPGVDGLILPTGDLDALTEAIDAAYRGEVLGG